MTRDQILDGYLNIVYFGQDSYGIQAAAQRYFAVPAAELSLAQAAVLAGLVQDPVAYDPTRHPAAATARRDVVLADMHQQGRITAAQLAAAEATPVKVTGTPVTQGCAAAGADAFFCDYVLQTVLTSPDYASLGRTAAEREQSLQAGGLVIHTTLQPDDQSASVAAVDEGVPRQDASGLAATAVTVRPGSAFKPFTLATWLAAGGTLSDVVDATPRAFPPSDFTSCGKPLRGSTPYVPTNSEGTESGPMSVLRATADSVNVAYVDLESHLDLCDIAATAGSLGVQLAGPRDERPADGPAGTALPTWFVGYAAQRSTAVWVGDPGRDVGGVLHRRQLTDITVDGRFYPVVYGADIAAPIWKQDMTAQLQALPAETLP